MLDSTYLNTKNIKTGKPSVFFIFSAYCPHCKSQLLSMLDNMDKLNETQIYMIAQEPLSAIREYYKNANLVKFPNIKMGIDTSGFLGEYMHVKGIPYLALFDKEKKLLKAYLGPTKTSIIKDGLSLNN